MENDGTPVTDPGPSRPLTRRELRRIAEQQAAEAHGADEQGAEDRGAEEQGAEEQGADEHAQDAGAQEADQQAVGADGAEQGADDQAAAEGTDEQGAGRDPFRSPVLPQRMPPEPEVDDVRWEPTVQRVSARRGPAQPRVPTGARWPGAPISAGGRGPFPAVVPPDDTVVLPLPPPPDEPLEDVLIQPPTGSEETEGHGDAPTADRGGSRAGADDGARGPGGTGDEVAGTDDDAAAPVDGATGAERDARSTDVRSADAAVGAGADRSDDAAVGTDGADRSDDAPARAHGDVRSGDGAVRPEDDAARSGAAVRSDDPSAGPEDETLPTLTDLLAARPEPRPGPAELGWRGAVRKVTRGVVALPPGPDELRVRGAVASVQRSLDGPRTVVVINPKGGAHKTTATLLIAATFGTHRGGYTLAWDNNETRGTLGWRSQASQHHNTAVNLLQDLDRFADPGSARVGDLDNYVRSQGSAQFDVLASDEDAASAASIDADAFHALHRTLSRFYRVLVVDTGNNMRASNWQAAVEAADQVVIVSTVREDTAQSAAWAVDALRATGHEEAVRRAVTVLADPAVRRDRALARRLHEHFGRLTRVVCDVPYDPSLVGGGPIDFDRLSDESRDAWLHVTAAVADGL